MAQLGYGTLKLHRDWVDATEVVIAATDRLRRLFPELVLQMALPHDTVLLYVHPALIEQALFNAGADTVRAQRRERAGTAC